jgi:hypothetical protein
MSSRFSVFSESSNKPIIDSSALALASISACNKGRKKSNVKSSRTVEFARLLFGELSNVEMRSVVQVHGYHPRCLRS